MKSPVYTLQCIYTYIHTYTSLNKCIIVRVCMYVCQRNMSVSAKRMIQKESQYFGRWYIGYCG